MDQKKKLTGKISEEKIKANKEEHVEEAQQQAEHDIEKDVDLNDKAEPGDDLDEGELANLEAED